MFRNCLLITAFFPWFAHAVVTFDANAFYYSDTYSSSTDNTYGRTFYDAALSIDLTKKGGTMIGWSYLGLTFTDDTATSRTVTSTAMGPKLTFYLDKENLWSLGLTYFLILNGEDSSQSGVTYEGSGYKGEFGYVTPLGQTFYIGAKFNYVSASFSRKITNQTSLSQVSYGRTAMYPSLSIMLRFE